MLGRDAMPPQLDPNRDHQVRQPTIDADVLTSLTENGIGIERDVIPYRLFLPRQRPSFAGNGKPASDISQRRTDGIVG